MTDLTAQQIESNYNQFVKELTALTRKYWPSCLSEA